MKGDRGSRCPTIREVAAAAGVSVGTASRVVNGAPNVDPGLRRNVERAIAELGFQPSIIAQNMKSRATQTVGVLISDITVPTIATFIRSAQEVFHAAGYAVLIGCHEHNKLRELDLLRFLPRRVDGLIMSTSAAADPDLLKAQATMTLPMVMRDRAPLGEADAVLIAHDEGTRQAADYLMQLGHRRIGLITGKPDLYSASSRVEGYREAIVRHGHSVDPELIRANSFSRTMSFAETTALLDLSERPTALIIGGIHLLPGALRAIAARGLRIPGDISLIAASDSDLAMLATPPITVLRWSDVELGEACARLMIERISGRQQRTVPRQIVLGTELIIRGSCAPPNWRHAERQ